MQMQSILNTPRERFRGQRKDCEITEYIFTS